MSVHVVVCSCVVPHTRMLSLMRLFLYPFRSFSSFSCSRREFASIFVADISCRSVACSAEAAWTYNPRNSRNRAASPPVDASTAPLRRASAPSVREEMPMASSLSIRVRPAHGLGQCLPPPRSSCTDPRNSICRHRDRALEDLATIVSSDSAMRGHQAVPTGHVYGRGFSFKTRLCLASICIGPLVHLHGSQPFPTGRSPTPSRIWFHQAGLPQEYDCVKPKTAPSFTQLLVRRGFRTRVDRRHHCALVLFGGRHAKPRSRSRRCTWTSHDNQDTMPL